MHVSVLGEQVIDVMVQLRTREVIVLEVVPHFGRVKALEPFLLEKDVEHGVVDLLNLFSEAFAVLLGHQLVPEGADDLVQPERVHVVLILDVNGDKLIFQVP